MHYMDNNYLYYVEGETERALINALKKEKPPLIVPGKVDVLNVIQKKITDMHLRTLKRNTTVVLIFDTDIANAGYLKENITKLQTCSNVSKLICIPQVKNLGDELINCTDVSVIKDLLGSKSNSDFKAECIREAHLMEKLMRHSFDIECLWDKSPGDAYSWVANESKLIKARR